MGPRGRRARRRGLIVGMAAGSAMANRGNKQQDDGQADSAGPDMTAQLQELQNLKDQGILTEEEFQAKKKQILGI